MGKPKWTAEQQAAISLRGQLLVAAAAGSGKTAVLVERMIQRIMDPVEPVDVDRFLVVTFTKAAANEMRERVSKALEDALFIKQDEREVERLLRQLNLLYWANITTLHSFCLELIRKHFYELELDPAFRVADQAEVELLRQDVVEELFESLYAKDDQAFLKLIDAFGSDRDDQPLMEHILRLYEFAYSQANPAGWLGGLEQAYMWNDIDSLMQSAWGQAIRQGLLDRVSESLDLLKRAVNIAVSLGGPVHYAELLHDDVNRIELFEGALQEGQWAQIGAHFQESVKFTKLPSACRKAKKASAAYCDLDGLPDSNSAPEEAAVEESVQKTIQEECKKLREEAKKKLNTLNEVFAYPIELQLPGLREMGTMAHTLGDIVDQFSQAYSAAKGRRNILDFTDLEHFALRLLEEEGEPSLIAQGLQKYYCEILVDEYQDINPVQERILQLVSRQEDSPNLFMVGDVKQSIYRFRMADPGLFLAKYNSLPHWQSNLPSDIIPPNIVIDLNSNFRSRREIVDGANFLFRQIMTEGAGEIPYDNQAALKYGASFVYGQDQICTAEGPIEIHLIDQKGLKNQKENSTLNQAGEGQDRKSDLESEPLEGGIPAEAELSSGSEDVLSPEDVSGSEELDKTRTEAALVSERIRNMVQGSEFQVYDKSIQNFRPVRYSDIVVLMRSYSALAPIYVEEFQKAGIPVYAETTTGYFDASEVETMLSLLKIIDNPHQDIPLAAVLRSQLVGLNGSELGEIRYLLPEGDFFEALTLAVWAGQRIRQVLAESVNDFEQILVLYEDSLEQRLEKAQDQLAGSPELIDKITDFWLKLQDWQTRSRRLSLADLLWSLYEETGYLAYVGTLPAGLQRQANLRVLYDRANRFEATRYRGLFRFLRFLERFQGQGKDMGNARALGEKENVVRLITVHASKGLEYPVVFVVGLGRAFNKRSLTGKILLHAKLGVGMPIIDVENNVRYPSLIQYAVKQHLTQESLAEELRILYVALTRAKERLLLYGNVDNFDNSLLKWLRTSEWAEVALPEAQLRSAKCFLDWIGPALARHPQHLFGETAGESALFIPEISSCWKVQIHHSLRTVNQTQSINTEANDQEVAYQMEELSENDDRLFTEVDRRLSWQYPYSDSVRQVAKSSVSELKRQYAWYTDEDSSKSKFEQHDFRQRPKFLQTAQPLNAAERGTAMHKAMQHLPFKEWATSWSTMSQIEQLNSVGEFLHTLERREIITPEEKESIQAAQILQFLGTPLADRLFGAGQILREVPFTLTFPLEGRANTLVQGVIDAVIIHSDEILGLNAEILDYKTDDLSSYLNHSLTCNSDTSVLMGSAADPEQILRERYALQLSIYALAIERLLHINVSRCTLYSFYLGREVTLIKELPEHLKFPAF